MDPTASVIATGLTKRFGATRALDGIDLDLRTGVTGLLGPNGAGKTTLLRMLATVLAPDDGDLRILGADPSDGEGRLAIRRRLGYLPQEPGFHVAFTAFEFVDYVAILKEMADRRVRHDEVRRVLSLVGLEAVMHKRIRHLSGGMRRRVGIAQALLGAPDLLLFDEPTAGLDPEQRLRFRELLGASASASTVLLSTHQTDDVAALCQRVVVLLAGTIRFDGTPRGLAELAAGRVWLATERDPAARLAWITSEGRVRHIGEPPSGVDLVEPTVEDAYLLLTGALSDAAGGLMVIILLPLAVVGAVVLLRTMLQRDGGPDVGWSTTAGVLSVPGRPPAPAPGRSSPWAVARALGRVEGRLLLRSFSFSVGLAFSAMVFVVFGLIWSSDFEARWENLWIVAPIFAYPLVGMTVIGVHSAVTRERRDGSAELFRSCPVPPAVRTAAHLRTAWVPVVGILAMLGAFGLASVWKGSAFGGIPIRSAGDVLAALALGVGGTCLGVAVARWAPWWPAPIAVIAVVAVVSTAISGVGEPGHWSPARQLSTYPRDPDYDPVFAVRPVWAHLGWLLALCAAVAVIAVAHDRRDRRVLVAGGLAALALVLTGFVTSRPLDAREAERVASMVAHPERHQECIEHAGGSFCTYGGFEDLRGMVADELAPVLAALPDGVQSDLVARQRFDAAIEELDPDVRERLPQPMSETDADVNFGFSSSRQAFVTARLATGLWAVGVPGRPGAGARPLVIAGESRGVVALCIVARGLELDDAIDLASAHPDPHSPTRNTSLEQGMPWPDPCEVGASPAVWAAQDLSAARALLALPEAGVQRRLHADWPLLTDPGTTTAQLVERFGLPPVGPIDQVPTDGWECG